MQQLYIFSRKLTKYCRKLMRLNNITYASRNFFSVRVECDVAVKWRIPPPNNSSSLKVSAILYDRDFDDIRVYNIGGQSAI